jgi:ABC-type bacteriocin/lantibiotic exporter with double-glycine peptidase domain
MSVELVPTTDGDATYDQEGQVVGSEYKCVNSPVNLSWSNVSVYTKSLKGELGKPLIDNLSGTISGGFWAIMGSSGSGK